MEVTSPMAHSEENIMDTEECLSRGEVSVSTRESNKTYVCSEKVPRQCYSGLSPEQTRQLFKEIWSDATSDHRLTLFGFRRFRTSHLVNLRFLEREIEKLDRTVYQAGLALGQRPTSIDRLGLKRAKKDEEVQPAEEIINDEFVERLRKLVKEYDEALLAFNSVMSMETFALADNISKAYSVQGLSAFEKFKTRLMRTDQPLRQSSRDPVQHYLRKGLRRFWYWWTKSKLQPGDEEQARVESFPVLSPAWERTLGNTARIAEIFARFMIALIAGATLVCPLVVLSYLPTNQGRLLVVAVCIILFCLVVSTLSKATQYEAMAASAAYAAVLTVFLSNTPSPS